MDNRKIDPKTLDFDSHSSVNVTDMYEHTVAPQLQLLGIHEVCRRLGIGRTALYEIIKNKQIRTVSIGKRRLVPVQALRDFITRLENYHD